jgi:hypothetical protein
MPVVDFEVLRSWGRVFRDGTELNGTESKKLRLASESLPWVECAGIHHPNLLQKAPVIQNYEGLPVLQ